MSMNPEVRAQWVAALRSGKYKQGVGRLKREASGFGPGDGEEFCCLGVLCDIQPPEVGHWVKIWDGVDYVLNGLPKANYGVSNAAEIPAILREKLGIDAEKQSRLISLNDRDHANFNEIANYIEQEV